VSADVTEAASAAPRSPEVLIQLGARNETQGGLQRHKNESKQTVQRYKISTSGLIALGGKGQLEAREYARALSDVRR
jgi:hypothetical protein